ncbi:beta strand repeat-containing protein [Lacipirellula limnantheis]|uniref:Autotransporter-associated beta strand repeat protein n=1 Tax=Lacipirellula limnantheis TaxID=2528024 RepID=A0A517TYS3_9BACT|nr:hypothetical protein [Lacipirellula limnantheis]QDT73524.1 hypothetical protein I41_27130 [Lacipirellula limnantheis]
MLRRSVGNSIAARFRRGVGCLGAAAVALSAATGWSLDRTWIGGNVDWVDAGAATNWNPNDEPDADDTAIFNTANTVDLGSNNAINGLTLSGGIDLDLNSFDLDVDGLVQTTGAGTNLFIGGAASVLTADDVTINGGAIELQGGTLALDEEVGTALLDINAGGLLIGNGVVSYVDAPLAFTTVLSNDGTITALSRPLIIFGAPPVGTLQINTNNSFQLIDLDGAGNAGVVNVNRNQTLDVNGTLADAFGGAMTLAHQSTIDVSTAWGLNAGTLTVNNGFVAGGLGVDPIPAGTSFIKGGTLTQTGGTINVADTDGTLQIDAPFTMSAGSLTNFGTVIFNGVTSITTAAGYAPSDVNSQTIVNANVTINDAADNFNWDGNGAADTTVNGSAVFSVVANQIDTTDNVFGGTVNVNDNADLGVSVAAGAWTLGGILNKNNAGLSALSGSRVIVTGSVNANDGTLQLPATTTTATANLTATGFLALGGSTEFGGASSISGTGTLQMISSSTVTASTTIDVATFDWDGLGTATTHTINAGATFTINSAVMDNDGDMDDPLLLAGNLSQLVVNNTNGLNQWTMTGVTTGNASAVGTATIGGTSRMIVANVINVNGNTTISAPVTFNRAGLVADIDAGMTLDVTSSATTYVSGTIDGAGTFDPGISNIVTGDFTINADRFDFDGGTWTVQSGATLTFNSPTDYEPDSVTNSFESTITLNNGAIFASVADPTVVMNGTLNMNASGGFDAAEWQGDAIDIGNDAGLLDANLNVTGDGNANSQARFFAPVTFMSDADVDVPAGASLVFNRPVTFNSVNAANNAEFTGAGTMIFSDDVNVNEAATLNMVGGTADLDGNDAVGDFVNIDAPLTINAASLLNFGRVNGGGGVNTLDVNNSVGTGVLTVNLDSPTAEWTLNGPGAMNLVNDNAEATLLAGSDVNINGTLNITGDVRTTARLDITGTVNINTAGQPLRLAGGTMSDPNMLLGGTIGGAGILGADTGSALHGFGTINTDIDFDGASNLFADDGTLTITGAIVDVARIGTNDVDGVLNVVNAWNTLPASFVTLDGGAIKGGTMTIDNANAVSGFGTIASRVINNAGIRASGGTLVVQTAGNDNDWDGAANNASLHAQANSTLELRDNATFGFTGSVSTFSGGKVFANGFALDFNPGSGLFLNSNGTYESTSSTNLGGVVTTSAGPTSRIKVTNNFFLTFESTSSTTLDANLELQNNNIIVEAGATFAGAGALIIPNGSHWVGENGANINVLTVNEGSFRPGNFDGIGAVTLKDFQQTGTGQLFVELTGTLLNQFDRLAVTGVAQLDGYLNIDVDGAFVPALGNTFNIITAPSVLGQFDYYDVSGMPADLAFKVNYLANAVQLEVVTKPIFSADFDDDGDVDLTDLSIWKSAFNLNQLGDANGDNITNGSDFLLWQQQLGSKPTAVGAGAVVPEPSAALLAGLTCFAIFQFGCRERVPSASRGANRASGAHFPTQLSGVRRGAGGREFDCSQRTEFSA